MLLSHILTMRGSDVASLLNFAQCLRRRQCDRQMDGRRTHGRKDTHTKKNVALAYPYHEGKRCSKVGRIRPVVLEEIA